ncbi:MAG: SprT-like domain-containing protein [Bacillota bacterium]
MKISEKVLIVEDIYNALNDKYFESALPKIAITIQTDSKNYGHFTKSRVWKDGTEQYNEINISAEYLDRPVENVASTVQHEMVHWYCALNGIKDTSQNGRYHNKKFKEEAEKRGLIIAHDEKIGWSTTTPSPEFIAFIKSKGFQNFDSHRISQLDFYKKIDSGELTLVTAPVLDKDGKQINVDGVEVYVDKDGNQHILRPKKKSSTRKYMCPNCGQSVRATKEVNILCGNCNVKMLCNNGENAEEGDSEDKNIDAKASHGGIL